MRIRDCSEETRAKVEECAHLFMMGRFMRDQGADDRGDLDAEKTCLYLREQAAYQHLANGPCRDADVYGAAADALAKDAGVPDPVDQEAIPDSEEQALHGKAYGAAMGAYDACRIAAMEFRRMGQEDLAHYYDVKMEEYERMAFKLRGNVEKPWRYGC